MKKTVMMFLALGALLLFVAQAALFYAAGRRSALKRRAEA